jgi:hypothetical protein
MRRVIGPTVNNVDFPLATTNIALLFMKMKTQYCLAESTVQALMNGFRQLFDVSDWVLC